MRPVATAWRAALAALLILTALAGPAWAQATATGQEAKDALADGTPPINIQALDTKLPGRRLLPRAVLAIGAAAPASKAAVKKYKGAYPGVYTKGDGLWQVSYFSRQTPPHEVSRVLIDDATGDVTVGPVPAASAYSSTTTTATDPNAPVNVSDLTAKQPGYRLTGQQVLAIARREADFKRIVKTHKGAYPGVYTKGAGRWQVSQFSRRTPAVELSQMYIDDATGKVTEHYTGYKVPWTMARGYSGAFGKKVNSPWVWIPMTVAFLLPFIRTKGVRIDLVAIAAFGIAVAFFNDADIGQAVPVHWGLMVWLMLRMTWIGLRRVPDRPPMKLWIPVPVMLVMVVFLLGFRIGLDVTNSNVIDVGYASVVGANQITDNHPLYAHFPKNVEHGDTYGPVMYLSYVPFRAIFGYSGRWDQDMPAAHAASIAFDVLCCLALYLLGRRLRGPRLGTVLAYAWASCPLTLYTLMSNSNDAGVALFLILALLLAGRPLGRGVMAAFGGLTKFATLGCAPLFAMHDFQRTRSKGFVLFAVGFAVAATLAMVPLWVHGQGFPTLYHRTLGFQNGRGAPFSPWGLYDHMSLQKVWQYGSVVVAVAFAFVPRRRDVAGLAALSAAIVLSLETGLTYWFYLYIAWFAAPVFVATFARFDEPAKLQRDDVDGGGGESAPEPEPSEPVDEPELVGSHASSSGSIAVARSF